MNSLIPVVPPVLYHYTCTDHGHPGIYGSGEVRPGMDGVVWLTDLEVPVRDAIGLTRVSTKCDRGAVRYRVDTADRRVVSWMEFRRGVTRDIIDDLETFPGAMSRHWFVALEAMPATYDPVTSH